MPANRFIGVWSLAGTGGIQKPQPAEMHRMTHADSSAEILMHVALQQWYYDKRVLNDSIGKTWKPHEYSEYLESLARNHGNIIQFVVYFNKEIERKEPPRDNSRNPNRAKRGPPTNREDDEAARTKREMAKRFRDAL